MVESKDAGGSSFQSVAPIDTGREHKKNISKEAIGCHDGLTLKWFSIGDFVRCQWNPVSLKCMIGFRIAFLLSATTGIVLIAYYAYMKPEENFFFYWEDWTTYAAFFYFLAACINSFIYAQGDSLQIEIDNKPPESVIVTEEDACLRPLADWCESMCSCKGRVDPNDSASDFGDDDVTYLDKRSTAMNIDFLAVSLKMYRTPWYFQLQWMLQNIAFTNIANIAVFWALHGHADPSHPVHIVNQILLPIILLIDTALSRLIVRITHVIFPVCCATFHGCFLFVYSQVSDTYKPRLMGNTKWETILAPFIFVIFYAFLIIPLTQLFLLALVHVRVALWMRMHKSIAALATLHQSLDESVFLTVPGHLEPPRLIKQVRVSPRASARQSIAEEAM